MILFFIYKSITPKGKEPVFLSCFKADIELVKELYSKLELAGHKVWWEYGNELEPGIDYFKKIKMEIKKSYAFIFCISNLSDKDTKSNTYSQVADAIEIGRNFPPGKTFIIPIKLSECNLPDYQINSTSNLNDLKPFYFDGNKSVSELIKVLNKARDESNNGNQG